MDGVNRKEGSDNNNESEEGTGLGTVALFEEFGQGRDLVPEIKRGKEEGQDDQQKGGHSFEVHPYDPVFEAIGSKPNHMDGRDVGCK